MTPPDTSHPTPSGPPATGDDRQQQPQRRHRPSALRKIVKAAALTILLVILLITVAITVAISYLKPERLTPIVERYANEYLDAKIDVERIEISFWSTFPRFELDIRGLDIRTNAFDKLPNETRALLPEYADSLIAFDRLSAAINIPRLMSGHIAIYDITVTSPRANIVQATPKVWSLDIFPPGDDEAEAGSDAPLFIPDITFGTFEILDGFPIRYLSLPDSIDASVNLTATRIKGHEAPAYKLTVGGLTSASVPAIAIHDLRMGIGGEINWSPSQPLCADFRDFSVNVGDVNATVSTSLDFSDGLLIDTLYMHLPPTPLRDIIAIIPQEMRGELGKVDSDLSIETGIQLTRPYSIGTDSIPSLDLHINVPEGSASYDGMKLDRFELQADASIDGTDLDRSTINITRLLAQGEGMGFLLTGKASDITSDPKVNGSFRGGLNIERLPASLLSMLPCSVKGILRADCSFRFRGSYLNNENFHKAYLSGEATLTGLDIDMPDYPADIYSRKIEFRLGTNSSFSNGDSGVDSLLTASLSIDTLSCLIDGMDMRGRGLKIGAGCRNTSSRADTTAITPIGGRITAERFSLRSDEDSSRIHLRDISIAGSLRRYKDDAHLPQLDMNISAGRALYGDRINRAMLSDAAATMTVHPSASPAAQRRRARIDSLRRAHPTLSRDSIAVLYRETFSSSRRKLSDISESGTTDKNSDRNNIEVDNSIRRILRQWNAHGSLRAERMRLFTPLFPLRNSISGLYIDFSTDSVAIHDTHVVMGQSDFCIDGSVSNITRALTSRSGRQPITATFDLSSDSIDVNEIASAVFAGAAFAALDSTGMTHLDSPIDENADENTLQSSLDMASADTASILIIPSNIEATLNVKANHITYSDLTFHDFSGVLSAFDGALNLSRLEARSDVGAVNLNALYTAPSKRDASFAFGLAVNGFRIGEFLDLIPAIDSVMPLLQGIDGVINADIAATTAVDSAMNIDIPSLKAAVKVSGDSLVVMDDETFRKIGKWLLFKDKTHNMIDSMTVEMIVDNSQMQMFPFVFNLDRYKLGVMGSNDLAMNFNYHIAVLKSPIPFKFGINVSGNPDDMKIRLGRAKFNEKDMAKTVSIADTTRVNLVQEIRNVFRRGVKNARINRLDFSRINQSASYGNTAGDTISSADSLYFIREGLIPASDTVKAPESAPGKKSKKKK